MGESELSPLMGLLRNYLKLAGGTMTGNITLGANLLKTTNHGIKELDGTWLGIRNAADSAMSNVWLGSLQFSGNIIPAADGLVIRAPNGDSQYLGLSARENGVGLAEIARLQGAAEPYFQATLPMRLYPTASALPAVEGMIGYNGGLRVYTAAGEKGIPEGASLETYASDTLQHSHDATTDNTDTDYTLTKEITISSDMNEVRIKFNFDCVPTTNEFAYGRIYINDVAVGTERSLNAWSGGSGTVYSEDFSGLIKGDRVQIYQKAQAGATSRVKDFRLYFDTQVQPATNTL